MSSFEPKPFGKYFLMDKLAVGGMAEIYKAKTFGVDGFEKLLAIKKILPHCSADKEFIAMLTDEAKLAVRLSHTNIVQIYDLGKVGDDYYISMEFIDGVNLRDLVSRAKELKETIPIPVCLFIVSEICKGLDYAHSKRDEQSHPLNIVHRDISPQNILISFDGETKIVDFGIAKAAMNMSQTTSGILKGKVTYMSPEQALGKPVDYRTDLFSAGLILYELSTGHKLFAGDSQFEVLKQIQTSQIRVDTLPNTLSPDIRHVLAKALAYDPLKRYDTAGDFQIALTKLLYTKFSDFSHKQMASLIQKWFAPELKLKQSSLAEKTSDGSQTQPLLKQPVQETLVHRSEESSFPEEKMMDTTQSEKRLKAADFKSFIPPPPSLRPRKRHSPTLLILLLLLMGGAGFFLTQKYLLKTSVQGELQILSDPAGAEIFINEQDSGETTPYLTKNVFTQKAYKVHLEKDGFEPWDQEIVLKNKKPFTLNASLLPKIEVPKEKPEAPTKNVPPATGTLFITSDPSGASIILDGKETGEFTPTMLSRLEFPKTYHLVLRKKDFQDLSWDVEIKSADSVKLSLDLKKIKPIIQTPQTEQVKTNVVKTEKSTPTSTTTLKNPQPPGVNHPSVIEKDTGGITGQVRVDSTPRGASVIFDGGKAGITPIVIRDVAKGKSHTVALSLPGYQSWSYSFSLTKGAIEISPKLQRE